MFPRNATKRQDPQESLSKGFPAGPFVFGVRADSHRKVPFSSPNSHQNSHQLSVLLGRANEAERSARNGCGKRRHAIALFHTSQNRGSFLAQKRIRIIRAVRLPVAKSIRRTVSSSQPVDRSTGVLPDQII